MQFAHDTAAGLDSMVALVNTRDADGADALVTVADLARFVVEQRWSGPSRRDAKEVAAVRALRTRLHALWALDVHALTAEVNALLRENHALPRLVDHDGWGYHLHATPDDAPLPARMAVEAAMALVDVIRAGEVARLRTCAAPGCGGVLADLTRNRSRRWCSTTCANRVNVAAHRARAQG